jgi:hypothetical protein
MKDHLGLDSPASIGNTLPSFGDWTAVNGTKAELMAGQHRIEALKVFLRRLSNRPGASPGLEKEQAWWVCDLYDIGIMGSRLFFPIKLTSFQIGFRLRSSFSFVPTERIPLYQTAMGRSGWNSRRWLTQTALYSKGKLAHWKRRCAKCSASAGVINIRPGDW